MKQNLFTLTLVLVVIAPASWSFGNKEGFVSLFDGKSLDGWVIENGEADSFVVQDNALYCPGTTGYPCWLRSELMYENYDLRFEFMIDGWTNSGFFFNAPLHGRLSSVGFEYQIYHDRSNRLTPNISGGIFNAKAPLTNAMKRPEQWNTARVLMDWPRLTMWLNGEMVQDLNLNEHEDLKYRLRKGYLGIQDVNYNTWFRNIRIRELPSKIEWTSLFNGTNLDGWYMEGEGSTFEAQNGVLHARGNGAYLVSEGEFEDFELHTYIRTAPNANGGIFFRWNTLQGGDRGNEIQIEDVPDSPHPTGSLYNIARADFRGTIPGEWYLMQIRVEGRHCMVRVNGETLVDYDNLTIIRPGHISLQMHFDGKWVEWKDIKIREL